jgi:hypothetical protein
MSQSPARNVAGCFLAFQMANRHSLMWRAPGRRIAEPSRINIRNEGTVPAMTWTIGNNQTACGVQTTIVTDGAVNAAADVYY